MDTNMTEGQHAQSTPQTHCDNCSFFELEEVHHGVQDGLLTQNVYTVMQHFNAFSGAIIAVLGVLTNYLNIKTFIAMGLEDGVTVSFLGLSISDFIVSFTNVGACVGLAFHARELTYGALYKFDPIVFQMLFTNISVMVYVVTILMTLYIAVARCMCVVRPLQFKHTFTKQKSWILIASFNLFSVIVYIPIWVNSGVTSVYSSAINGTRYVLWFSEYREQAKDGVQFITQTLVPAATEVIVIFCVLVMSRSLREAAKFRNASSSANALSDQESDPKSDKLSGKDIQVVQQVVLISVVFVILNSPMIILGIVGAVTPGFDAGWGKDRFVRSYYGFHLLRKVLEQINSTSNIVIYLKYNSKFRSLCKFC